VEDIVEHAGEVIKLLVSQAARGTARRKDFRLVCGHDSL
jgi:hypothetical protein